jgi:hypothetical protein
VVIQRAPALSAADRRRPPSRSRGWWGVGFVLLLTGAEAAVALPLTSRPTAFITAYYAVHRWPITVAQVAQLGAAAVLWRFLRAFADSLPAGRRSDGVRWAGLAVCLVSLQTSAPVLALALVPGWDPSTARTLASWTDSSDLLLFAVVTVWAAACSRAALPVWVRTGAALLGCLALARVAVGVTGSTGLSAVAPLGFVVFVLALAARMIAGGAPRPGGRRRGPGAVPTAGTSVSGLSAPTRAHHLTSGRPS